MCKNLDNYADETLGAVAKYSAMNITAKNISAMNISAKNITAICHKYHFQALVLFRDDPSILRGTHILAVSNDGCILAQNVSSSLISMHYAMHWNIQPTLSKCVNMLGIACLMCGFPPGESSWPCASPVLKSFQSQGLILTNTFCNLDKYIF